MKLAIIGSRSFDDYDLLCRMVGAHYPNATVIVSGGAIGADRLARQYAREHGLELLKHLPDWKRFGRGAGQIRNRLIIDDADAVLTFWDGISKGTRGGLEYAKLRDKRTLIVYVSDREGRTTIVNVEIHSAVSGR